MSAKLPEFTDEQYPPDLELRQVYFVIDKKKKCNFVNNILLTNNNRLLQIVHRHGKKK
jgi:hypothetical protein